MVTPRHPFRPIFSLLLASGLLLAQPVGTHAASQVQCRPGSDGGWACSPVEAPRALPPRPGKPVVRTTEPAAEAITEAPSKAPRETVSRAPSADFSELDWVPRDQLSEAQRAAIAPYCSGDYIEPPRIGRDDDTPFDQLPIYATADSSSFEQNNQTGTLEGDVVMRQGRLQAQANQASFDQNNNLVRLDGNVRLRDQGVLVLGESAQMHVDTGEARVDQVRYVMHEANARGEAESLRRRDDAIIVMTDGSYTTCDPGRNTWALHSDDIELDREKGWGEARHVTLRVKDVPVFYTPYIYFPIDDRRQSGLLVPSLSYSSNSGTEYTQPYYFNLAPNYDATLYPTLMSDRGLQLEGEFRYLTPRSEGQIGASVLDDREDERELQSDYRDQRWMYSWQHHTDITPRLQAEVDYTEISDPYYFQDLNTHLGINTRNFLDQRAGLSWQSEYYRAGLNVHAYERATVTDITPYERLPQLTLAGTLPYQPGGLRFNYDTEFVSFQRNLESGFYTDQDGNPDERWYDDRLTGLTRAEGERLHVEPGLSLPMNWNWGFVKPSLKYAYTRYDLSLDGRGRGSLDDDERFDSSQDRSLPILSVDSGLYFDRPTNVFGQSYTQTLEPRLFYLYVPEEDQSDIPIFDTSEPTFTYDSLWRDNRFSGRDRIGDANQVSLGVTNRWLEDDGFERQRFSIGQSYYFRDREVQLRGIDYRDRDEAQTSESPIALAYQYRYNQDWRFTSTFNWDADQSETRSGSAMWHYQPADNPRKILNVGYLYRNETMRFDRATGRWTTDPDFGEPGDPNYIANYYKTDQHDISFMWPVSNQWSLIGRWQRDYGRNRTVEAFGGFEYDSCCWKLRVINRYWIDYDETSLNPNDNDEPDRGIFLQIVFKGLGNIAGGGMETLLEESITGYRERESNAF